MARNTIRRQAPGLFDIDNRLADLTRKGDILHRPDALIDWKGFLTVVDPLLGESNSSRSGGRPAFSSELMLKLLIVQSLYNLSDAQAEFQANDRLSFQRFLGLTLADRVPDQNTIREFRETLVKANGFERLFELFNGQLQSRGLLPKNGSVINRTCDADV